MKPFIANLLIALFLFSFTPMKEIMKFPKLLIHYYEHVEETPGLTISEFLDMHYLHGIVFDEDYEQDMQLPFKVIDFTTLPVFVLNENKIIFEEVNDFSFIVRDKINTSYRFHLSDAKVSGIFHPPRIS